MLGGMFTTAFAARYRRLATIVTATMAVALTGRARLGRVTYTRARRRAQLGLPAARPGHLRARRDRRERRRHRPAKRRHVLGERGPSAVLQQPSGTLRGRHARASGVLQGPRRLVVPVRLRAHRLRALPELLAQPLPLRERLLERGYAENIFTGWGYGSNTAREAVRWWLNSEPTAPRCLDPQWTLQGMNVYRAPGTYQGHPDTQIWVHYLCR